MSQLPSRISLKRRLDEEAPETLFVEREGQESPAVNTHARPIYRLVSKAKRARPNDSTYASVSNTTKSSSLLASTPSEVPVLFSQPTESQTSKDQDIPTSASKPKVDKALQPRRVFHLSTTKSSSLSRSSSSSSLRGGIVKRRSKHGSSVAVFAEKRAARIGEMVQTIINSRSGTPGVTDDEETADSKSRKRPLARSTVQRRKDDTSRVVSDAETDANESLDLAAQLREFALNTIPQPVEEKQSATRSIPAIQKKPLKYQPKPPASRKVAEQRSAISTPASIIKGPDALEEDTSGDWVYDIYVREILPPGSKLDIQSDASHVAEDAGQTSVGVIVIRPKDEAEWEEFMSDQEDSDRELDGDEDDSNAEDYYANDYPDEWGSDDDWAEEKSSDAESYGDEYAHSANEED